MSYILTGVVGIVMLFLAAFLISNNKKKINYKAVAILLALQLLFCGFLLKTSIGLQLVAWITTGFNKIIQFGTVGVDFVVGGWVPEGGAPFFVNVLMIIIFTSALLSVLTHLKILPYLIKYAGGLLSKVTGLPKIESFNAINSVFFGQQEAIVAIKSHISHLNGNRLFIISVSAMASISAAVVGSYMTMLPSQYVLVAIVLNLFSGLIIGSIVAPVEDEDKQEEIDVEGMIQTKNIFDAIAQGALDGGKVVLIVATMLVAFLGILAMANGILDSLIGTDLTTIFGYLFAPIAFLMGVPAAEILDAGSIMGTKLFANEFVAILEFQPMIENLSERTTAIISTYLISFAAFGSIGIISGTVQAINGAKAKEVSGFGLKLLLAATMVSILSGAIVGLFV